MGSGTKKKAGIKEELLEQLEFEVMPRFRDRAVLALLEVSNKQSDQPIELAFAEECGYCISAAVGEFADLITQAALAQAKTISRKAYLEIVNEASRFAARLEDATLGWLSSIMKTESVHDIPTGVKERFLGHVRSFRTEWRFEAENKIRLRCLLTHPRAAPQDFPPEDKVKLAVWMMKRGNRNISLRQICLELDSLNERRNGAYSVLKSWEKKSGQRTWIGVYADKKTRRLIAPYLSKIKLLR